MYGIWPKGELCHIFYFTSQTLNSVLDYGRSFIFIDPNTNTLATTDAGLGT